MNHKPVFALCLAVLCAACSLWVAVVNAQEAAPPAMPAAASKPGVSRVVVRTLVDGTGAVQATQIRESSGNSRLDEEALQVVSKVWTFSPLKINGKGIEVWVNVPINFVQAETPAVPKPVPAEPVVMEPAAPASAPQPPAAVPDAVPVVSSPAEPAEAAASTPSPAASAASAPN